MREILLLALLAGCARTYVSSPPATAPVAAPTPPPPVLRFSPLAPPATPADGAVVRTAERWTWGERSGEVRLQLVLHDGQEVGGERFGVPRAPDGSLLPSPDGAVPWLTHSLDYAALIGVGGRLRLFNHVETPVSALYLTDLELGEDGTLTPTATEAVDLRPVHGMKDACAGDVTPWGTLLSGEEYEPDEHAMTAEGRFDPERDRHDAAWNRLSQHLTPARPWAYDYGWIVETTPGPGPATVAKRRALGRFSHELGVVMPDERTVYLTDDVGRMGGIFLFVADRPRDLSAGALYALRWIAQTRSAAGGAAEVRWVPLGRASDAELAEVVQARTLRATDLLDFAPVEPDGTCAALGHKRIDTHQGVTCAAVQRGKGMLASRFETRRFAALSGASIEFSKAEGLAYDPDEGRVFVAISKIAEGMSDGAGDVRVDPNPCGGIYALGGLGARVADVTGAPIDSDHVARTMEAVLVGGPRPGASQACDVDAIANPDNLAYLPGHRLLIVAEDTDAHTFATLWAVDTRTWAPSRLATAPWCAEWAGLHWSPDLNGHGWLSVSLQHLYAAGSCRAPDGLEPPGAHHALTGVFGPFPSLVQPDGG